MIVVQILGGIILTALAFWGGVWTGIKIMEDDEEDDE